jgi:thiosulfate dehydrogenase [quinone] large subunit
MTTLQNPTPVFDRKPGTAAGRAAGTAAGPAAGTAVGPAESVVEPTTQKAARYVFAALRIGLGFVFGWAFLDKLFGLGHETTAKGAWINGGNPTKGFLSNGAQGPFTDFYHNIAGAGFTNWLFMLALLGVSVTLIAGIGMRVAAIAGGLLLVMMWTVVLPPANNPFMDDHLIYAGVLAALALVNAGDTFGLGKIWGRTELVQRAPILK